MCSDTPVGRTDGQHDEARRSKACSVLKEQSLNHEEDLHVLWHVVGRTDEQHNDVQVFEGGSRLKKQPLNREEDAHVLRYARRKDGRTT